MDKERIKEIFSDKEFVTELISLETPTDIQALLKTKGIDLDLEQIEKGKKWLLKNLNNLQQAKTFLTTKLAMTIWTKFPEVL